MIHHPLRPRTGAHSLHRPLGNKQKSGDQQEGQRPGPMESRSPCPGSSFLQLLLPCRDVTLCSEGSFLERLVFSPGSFHYCVVLQMLPLPPGHPHVQLHHGENITGTGHISQGVYTLPGQPELGKRQDSRALLLVCVYVLPH